MINQSLYSRKLADYSSVVIIDGKVAKNRFDFSLTKEILEELKLAGSKVMIQNGEDITIYCDTEDSVIYKTVLARLKNMGVSAEDLRKIKISYC